MDESTHDDGESDEFARLLAQLNAPITEPQAVPTTFTPPVFRPPAPAPVAATSSASTAPTAAPALSPPPPVIAPAFGAENPAPTLSSAVTVPPVPAGSPPEVPLDPVAAGAG